MKRNRTWWSRLSTDERSELVILERGNYGGNDGYIPDDCHYCSGCGLCGYCSNRLNELIRKGNGE
jgi:hypothetical protein